MVEWNGTWEGEWMSWKQISERFEVTKEEIDKLVKKGKIRTKRILNDNNPGKNPYFLGYFFKHLVENLKEKKERTKRKTEKQKIDEALDEMDRRCPGYDDR